MGIRELLLDRARHEGELKKQLEIACELKKEGLSIEFIMKTTKLSKSQIEQL